MTEYTDSYIRSSGNTYVDMDYSYISDCGSFKYVLRHIEFPQRMKIEHITLCDLSS